MPPDVGTVYRQWRILAHLWRGGQRGQHSTPSRPLSVIRHFDAKTTPSIMTNKNYEQFKVFIKKHVHYIHVKLYVEYILV